MSSTLKPWPRSRFEEGGGDAVLLYALYGEFPETTRITNTHEYRTTGLPPEIQLHRYRRSAGQTIPFLGGDLAKILREDNPEKFEWATRAPECLLLKGEFADPPDLNYLRDTVGIVSWFLDHGSDAIIDPQRLRLYGPLEWWEEVYAPDPPNLATQVVILSSPEPENRRWLHTRGMRKFGRPDLSVHGVTKEEESGQLELINRLIVMQAEGARVQEGQPIQMRSLPPGLTCHHDGDVDDPDFNNVHIEIRRTRHYSF